MNKKLLVEFVDEMLKRYYRKYDWGMPDDIDPHDCNMSASELERSSFCEQFDMSEFIEIIQNDVDFNNLVKDRLNYGNY